MRVHLRVSSLESNSFQFKVFVFCVVLESFSVLSLEVNRWYWLTPGDHFKEKKGTKGRGKGHGKDKGKGKRIWRPRAINEE